MSATIIQINPPITLNTPKGEAVAHFLIDYGVEQNIMWVCFQDDTGECLTWDNSKVRACNWSNSKVRVCNWGNSKVRACENITLGRESISEIK